MWIQKQTIQKFVEVKGRKHIDSLIMERPIEIFLDGTSLFKTTYTPSKEKELCLGYALSHNLIQSKDDVQAVTIEPPVITLKLAKQPTKDKIAVTPATINLIHIYELTAYFQEKAMLFKDTAISESGAIAKRDKILAFSEDLCRFNAFYKSVGSAMVEDIPLSETYFLTSSKVDEAFIKEIIQVGITVIISRTAPTTAALKLAEEHNVLLIGFARGRKCNVYTFAHRILR